MRRSAFNRVMVIVSLALAAGMAATARGENYDFSFSIGYSNIELENNKGLFYDHDGPYFDADFAFNLAKQSSIPLLVGIGVSGSGYFDSQDQNVRLSATTVATATLYSDIGFFELEPRIATAFYSKPGRTGLFVRPRLGAGLLIDSYGIDHVTQSAAVTVFETLYHTGAAFEVRPAVQVGYCWGQGELGVEANYMIAWGDFGDFGSEAHEYRIGPFFTYRF
jgi:hypothetical protein